MSSKYDNEEEFDKNEEEVPDTENVGTLCEMESQINSRWSFIEQEILKDSKHIENGITMQEYLNRYNKIAKNMYLKHCLE